MTQQYQVLARKYRPKNFHELIGQTHVSQALINAIDYKRLHHAYLFTGTRGVGKTTIARILSKCLNCDTGVTSTPCGVCDNCVAIDQGRFIDLIEIDAASRTKVEDTRELLDNVPYAPSQGRYKVYLIDEVHMLSTHSFNALLKTLEEPPEHVKFLLATTDPQKLPITIISRCLQFVLRPLPQTQLSEHLANILTQEQVQFTQPALWQLASAAKGSVRDALSLTDQAIAFGQGALDDATVNAMLGLIDAADLVRLITDIYNHDKSAVAAHIEQMRAQMVDASAMFDGLAELLHQLALTQLLPEVALNVNEAQAQTITTLAEHISPDVLQLYYEIIVQAREGIKLASTPMQALEMSILRLLAFRALPVDEMLVSEPTVIPKAIDKAVDKAVDMNTTDSQMTSTPKVSSGTIVASTHEPQVYEVNISMDNEDIDNEDMSHKFVVADDNVNNPLPAHLEASVDSRDYTDYDYTNHDYTSHDYADNDLHDNYQDYQSHQSYQSHQDNEPVIHNVILKPEPTVEPTVELITVPLSNDSQSITDSQVIIDTDTDDPRTLLRCPPQTLTGEWTPEKWDYWLQTARENGTLAEDERAFARQGIITGQCNGQATFITAVDSTHVQATFQQLVSCLQQQFTQADIRLQTDSTRLQLTNQTPEHRQKIRQQQAISVAESMLTQSPVMQYLITEGQGIMGHVQLI